MTTVTQHPASVDAYLRHGMQLVAIPPFSKGPTHKGWNLRGNLLTDHTQLPPVWNIGLAHAYSGTMAVDVDDWARAATELEKHGISLQGLYDAPDAVVIDSGRQGHGKLIYRMPFGLALPSHKWMDSREDGTRYNYLDFRCGTSNGLTVQDVLPPSIHPLTGQPYRWAGLGHWTRLPAIPDALLALWTQELQQAHRPTEDAPVNASWDEIRSALHHISPDCSREEWITVGMALHFAGTVNNDMPAAATLWDQWSQPSSKYPGPKDMETQWRSFRADKATKVKLGSLFHLAIRGGWVRPTPDASTLFGDVEPGGEHEIINSSLRPMPPELDFDLIPPVLARAAQDIGAAVGCDPLVPLFAGLAAISGAADARTRLELVPGFKVPPVLWAMTIGDPADKKTPGSAPMFDVLLELEREDRPRFQQALQVYEALEARHEAAKKSYLDAAKDVESMLAGEVPQGYGEAPVPPTPLRTLVQDINSQKLVRVCAAMPRGVLVYLDEMHSWVNKLADPRSGEQASTWTTGYESRYYKLDRVGAGEIEAENFAISMYGNIQPRVFAEYVKKLSKDGMLQRFVPVMLRGNMTRLGRPSVDRHISKREFDLAVRSIYGMPAMTYHLSTGASAVFRSFQEWYHIHMADEKLVKSSDVYLQAFGKIEGLTGRLMLLFHLIMEPWSMHVSTGTAERVVEMMRTYIAPSMRFAFNGDLAGVESFDNWMMEYVIQWSDVDVLSMPDIKNNGRRQLEGLNKLQQTDAIVSAMWLMEKAGWVARVDDRSAEHRGHAEWAVNPLLRTVFKEHRINVIAAKDRMMNFVGKGAPPEKRHKVHGWSELAVRASGL